MGVRMNKPQTILIADDHPLIRDGLRSVIESEDRFRVVAETGNGAMAHQLIVEKCPDIAVLDIDMPGKNGLQMADELRKQQCPTKVVILTMYDEQAMLNRAIEIGVLGYVLKDSAGSEILDCLAAVSDGEPYVSPALSKYLLGRKKAIEEKRLTLGGLSVLTSAEMKILKLIAEGKGTKDIAAELSVSAKTIENHRSNICAKLDVHGTNALLRFAMENREVLVGGGW